VRGCNPYSFRARFHLVLLPRELPAGRAEIPNLMAAGDAIGSYHLKAEISFSASGNQRADFRVGEQDACFRIVKNWIGS
jgi:hypothetical protein